MRLNYIALTGFVSDKIALVQLADESWVSKVKMRILRPELAKKVEDITVYFRNSQKVLDELLEGDYVEVQGHVETMNYKKEITHVCDRCGTTTVYEKSGEELFVFGDKFRRIDCQNVLNDTDNVAIMLGEICTDSNYYDKGAKPYNKFKIAINRYGKPSYEIIDGVETLIKADFPFIVTFGKQAERAKQEVQKGAYICVKGVLQERTFKRNLNVECSNPECGLVSQVEQTETVREILATNTEYFKDRKPVNNNFEDDFEY